MCASSASRQRKSTRRGPPARDEGGVLPRPADWGASVADAAASCARSAGTGSACSAPFPEEPWHPSHRPRPRARGRHVCPTSQGQHAIGVPGRRARIPGPAAGPFATAGWPQISGPPQDAHPVLALPSVMHTSGRLECTGTWHAHTACQPSEERTNCSASSPSHLHGYMPLEHLPCSL